MPQNDLVPFAYGASANVLSPAQLAGLSARTNGFSSGTASSPAFNAILRQAAFVAAMIGSFTANGSGQSTLDNGDLDTFETNFRNAVTAALGSDATGGSGGEPFATYFTDTGYHTWTVPDGLTKVLVQVWGAGGGGGGATSAAAGFGGSGGGYGEGIFIVTPGDEMAINVGVGGTGGTTAGTAGANGGMSSFGPYLTSTGGVGGPGSATVGASVPAGGTSSGGGLIIPGQSGNGTVLVNGVGFGAQGGGAFGSSMSRVANGGTGQSKNGQYPGGGGTGATTQQGATLAGYTGANGLVIIRGINS